MSTRSFPKVAYDGALLLEDAAANGLDAKKLAAKTRPRLALRTVYRFINNEVQTPTTAGILAAAVGQPVSRYLVRTRKVARAS